MKNILLLHGALGVAHDLQPLAKLLTEKGLSVHTLTFSGHGQTHIHNDLGINTFKNDVTNYLEQQQIKNCHIFGYSMGGYVALLLASEHYPAICKVTCLATKINWTAAVAEKEAKNCSLEFLAEKAPELYASLALKHQHLDALLKLTASMLLDLGKQVPLGKKELNAIQIPVMYCLGDKDKMVDIEETMYAQQNTASSSLCILPNCKHPITSVPISMLAEALAGFVSED